MYPFYVPLASVFFAFEEANASGQLIVGILFIGSVFAWSIMITKTRELLRIRRETRRFLSTYREQPNCLSLAIRRKVYGFSPAAAIYEVCCEHIGGLLEPGGGPASEPDPSVTRRLTARELRELRSLAAQATSEHALLLEENMSFLATAVTTAPFLGLLGTVWGVMDAFSGMAVTGSSTLAAVAPGISGALLTTVVALIVAIPSSVGYNLILGLIRRIRVYMESFTQQFLADIERDLVGDV